MNPALPTQVITAMATRPERLHHMLWHMMRNDWLSYPPDVRQKLADMCWEPPRPARTPWDDGYLPILTNNSGEDFLYMHRQMIAHVNGILAQVGDPNYPRVEGWMHIPAPAVPDYPVPPAGFDPTDLTVIGVLQRVKSDTFYYKRIKMWERMYTAPTFLKGMSLGELGARLDMTIHNALHNRWSAYPGADRPDADPTQPETIDPQWDDPHYNYLGDFYSSHVNPIFWRLHGWVDDRIDDWKAANGVFGDGFWQGTWVGNMEMAKPQAPGTPSPLHAMLDDPKRAAQHGQAMEQVARIIAQPGVFHTNFQMNF